MLIWQKDSEDLVLSIYNYSSQVTANVVVVL